MHIHILSTLDLGKINTIPPPPLFFCFCLFQCLAFQFNHYRCSHFYHSVQRATDNWKALKELEKALKVYWSAKDKLPPRVLNFLFVLLNFFKVALCFILCDLWIKHCDIYLLTLLWLLRNELRIQIKSIGFSTVALKN